MACKLQKLFSVEAEFEDEDFLMAVSDVEKQTLDTTSANLRGLRPLSAGLRAPDNAFMPVKDSGTRSFSESMPPISQVQNCSRFQFGEGICTTETKSNHMLPLISSFKVQKDPTGLLAKCESGSTSGKRFKFVNRPPVIFSSGTSPRDDIDNELVLAACMDLEESSMYPESFRFDCGSQKQIRDNDLETAKKRQVTNSMTPMNPVGLDTSQMTKTRKEIVDEVVSHLQPVGVSSESNLRPPSIDSGFPQANLGMSNSIGSLSNSSIQMIKPVQSSLEKSTSECNSPSLPLIRPCSPFISTSTPSRLSKSRIFSPSCSDSRMANNGGQLHITYGPSVATVGIPPVIPKAPSSVAGSGKPQTPVVTNHLVRLVTATSKTPQPMAHVSLRTKTRRFPGPAGILPQQVREHSGDTPSGKNLDEILIATPQMPTHGAVAKLRTEEMPISQQTIEEEFERGPWVAMKNELDLDEGDPSCFLQMYSISMILRKAALKQLPKNKVPNMAVMIKSLMRTNVDAGAEFRDPTGEMQGTIHRLLLEEKESEFKTGSVLLLKQVSVFSPSHRNHYLNVTPSNLVKIYSSGFNNENQPQPYQEIWETSETVTPQDPPISAVIIMATVDNKNVEGCERNKKRCHRILASNESPSLLQESGSCGASKSTERADLDDLDQLLGELPDDFFSSLEEQNTL
ncbi:homologous recombination OB-fold protein isoform X1 [Crotalus tigris]|uniref:homologous recombination OB-fold protein isoform X1 n=2 Tax=Crotalus tigris TaxID=88082 RepID=UPI00192F19F6|nr:homologous recombination OB-fold protein isoform X1 [Crotalus tigris]